MKTLVLYVFHQYNARVKYFLERAIFKHDDIDFVIVCNSRDLVFESPDYVEVVRRDNIGYDFGGWTDGLLIGERYKAYDTFVFVNSSVFGPFLPKDESRNWVDVFVSQLNDSDRLVGPTINTVRDPLHKSHVQSYAFAVHREALEYLLSNGIFAHPITFNDAIYQHEVRMSRVILENGWNIASFLDCYTNVDFRFKDKQPADYSLSWFDDVMFPSFENNLWTSEEVMFLKGNRFGIN